MAMLALSMGESEVVLEFPGDADGIEKALAIAEEMKLEVSKSESGNFLIKISADSVATGSFREIPISSNRIH